VAVALQLGLGLCAAHTCRCGSQVDGYMGHHALNDIISRAFASAKIQVTKEPSGLFRSDGKRPDSLTLIPWQRGLSLTWLSHGTLQSLSRWQTPTFRPLHPQLAPQLRWRRPDSRKQVKYAALSGTYVFQPIALETLGSINESAVQRFNAILMH